MGEVGVDGLLFWLQTSWLKATTSKTLGQSQISNPSKPTPNFRPMSQIYWPPWKIYKPRNPRNYLIQITHDPTQST